MANYQYLFSASLQCRFVIDRPGVGEQEQLLLYNDNYGMGESYLQQMIHFLSKDYCQKPSLARYKPACGCHTSDGHFTIHKKSSDIEVTSTRY